MTMLSNETLIAGGTMNVSGQRGPQGPKGDPGEDGTIVSVSDTGTSTNEVYYITVDGVESKLPYRPSEVYWVDYNNTTFTEWNNAKAAFEDGKIVFVQITDGNRKYVLRAVEFTTVGNNIIFSSSIFGGDVCIYYFTNNSVNISWIKQSYRVVPETPDGLGRYVLKSVNGTVTWVQE